jgi:metal-responsive CopG/Arc/MetJ family transcriptional regulator
MHFLLSEKAMKKKGTMDEVRRISIYIYDQQLETIKEICQERKKTRRIVFFEAIQAYISLFKNGEV